MSQKPPTGSNSAVIEDNAVVLDGLFGDGSDERAAIAAQIATGAGEVVIPEGTFTLGSSLSGLSGVTIRGRGEGITVLKAKAGTNINVLSALGASNLHIADLTIDCNSSNVVGGNGINLVACSDFSIRNVTVLNAFNAGILIDASGATPSTDGLITGCTIRNSGGHAIALSGTAGAGFIGGPQHIRVTGNHIFNAGLGGTQASSINCSQVQGCAVTGNTIVSTLLVISGYAGVRLSNGASFNTVSGNTIQGTSRGIYVPADAGAGDGPGRFNTIGDNNISNTLQQGILCESPYNTIDGNSIVDCCQDAGSIDGAIRVNDASFCLVTNNTVVDNVGTKHQYGIEVTGTSNYCTIDGNTIDGWTVLPLTVSGVNSKVGQTVSDMTIDIASAATLGIRDHTDLANVTGSTGITAIGGNPRVDRDLTLLFNGNLVVANGATIALANAVNFNAVSGAMLRLRYNGTAWVETARKLPTSPADTISSNSDQTLSVFTSASQQYHTATLTADRALNLPTANVSAGKSYRVTRTGGGAFNLNVQPSGGGVIKALATNQWGDFAHDGSAWKLLAFGSL